MLTKDYNDLVERLTLMAECEVTVGEFYDKCSQAFSENRQFWASLAEEEAQHARIVRRLREIVLQKPHQFQVGKPFAPAALKTFIAGIRTSIEKLAKGTLPETQASTVARDIENALIEQQYVFVIKTENAEFQRELKKIIAAEHEHKKRVEENRQMGPKSR
jgi:hypothetical protein